MSSLRFCSILEELHIFLSLGYVPSVFCFAYSCHQFCATPGSHFFDGAMRFSCVLLLGRPPRQKVEAFWSQTYETLGVVR
mgnify:CR=1 FL=1